MFAPISVCTATPPVLSPPSFVCIRWKNSLPKRQQKGIRDDSRKAPETIDSWKSTVVFYANSFESQISVTTAAEPRIKILYNTARSPLIPVITYILAPAGGGGGGGGAGGEILLNNRGQYLLCRHSFIRVTIRRQREERGAEA